MAAPSSAIVPGVDLGDHARALRAAHEAVVTGRSPSVRPRPVVARSWRRALSDGLRAGGGNRRSDVLDGEVESRRRASPLRIALDEVRGLLAGAADAAPYIVVVADGAGVLLWRDGPTRVRRIADGLGFVEGALWTERRVGTNAIGTALEEAAPVELFAAEHFEQQQHAWYCSAAPVHDPRTGELIGIVDISGPAMAIHPALHTLVLSSTRLAEESLWRWHQTRLDGLRRATEHVVGAGPALVVDDDGWVAHRAGATVGDRVAAPAEGQPLAVPGMGICFPERLHGGWLIRPTDRATALRATLTGTLLVVESDRTPWQVSLTPRHAEVLRLLVGSGRDGLNAAQLSAAVFGDRAHEISVRAEVSRLRRVVGPLVTASPYRIADGVAFRVAEG